MNIEFVGGPYDGRQYDAVDLVFSSVPYHFAVRTEIAEHIYLRSSEKSGSGRTIFRHDIVKVFRVIQ